ncbi:MAG: hypothetical protein FD171_1828 [Actinobacteria bacterium]|nr:MAG: hypothetical protein FD171_1828 [Actinomycetota bacterium]
MHDTHSSTSNAPLFGAYLASLSREVCVRGSVHPDSAARALRATSRRLGADLRGRSLDYADRRRVRAYYFAVLRNAAFEQALPVDRTLRERIKIASLVADLRSVGASALRIRQEVESFYGSEALEHLVHAGVAS